MAHLTDIPNPLVVARKRCRDNEEELDEKTKRLCADANQKTLDELKRGEVDKIEKEENDDDDDDDDDDEEEDDEEYDDETDDAEDADADVDKNEVDEEDAGIEEEDKEDDDEEEEEEEEEKEETEEKETADAEKKIEEEEKVDDKEEVNRDPIMNSVAADIFDCIGRSQRAKVNLSGGYIDVTVGSKTAVAIRINRSDEFDRLLQKRFLKHGVSKIVLFPIDDNRLMVRLYFT